MRIAITLFILGLMASLFGSYGIAGLSITGGKTLFISLVFLSLFVALGTYIKKNH